MRIRYKDPVEAHTDRKYDEFLRSIGRGWMTTPRYKLEQRRRARRLRERLIAQRPAPTLSRAPWSISDNNEG